MAVSSTKIGAGILQNILHCFSTVKTERMIKNMDLIVKTNIYFL